MPALTRPVSALLVFNRLLHPKLIAVVIDNTSGSVSSLAIAV